ncbi:MAG: DUF2117 domain-containing protein [Candidatus Methanomethylicaceae archaeon]
MFLILYDIEGKRDPHGIRIRLVRALRGAGAFQLQKSSWIVENFNDRLLKVIEEFRGAGGSVKVVEWLPRTFHEVAGKINSRKVVLAPLSVEPLMDGWHEKIRSALENSGFKCITVPVGRSVTEFLLKERIRAAEKSHSRILDEISLMDIDGIVFLNTGRSTQSGIVFLAQILSNTRLLKTLSSLPLIQVERAGRPDGAIILWNDLSNGILEVIRRIAGLNVIRPSLEMKKISKIGNREIRQIQHAEPGDIIVLDGKRVGVCLTSQVYLVAENGKLVDIIGGKIFRRAASKISFESLSTTIVKTLPA